MFSCECCENSKNTFFTEHLWWLLLVFDEVKPAIIDIRIMNLVGD